MRLRHDTDKEYRPLPCQKKNVWNCRCWCRAGNARPWKGRHDRQGLTIGQLLRRLIVAHLTERDGGRPAKRNAGGRADANRTCHSDGR